MSIYITHDCQSLKLQCPSKASSVLHLIPTAIALQRSSAPMDYFWKSSERSKRSAVCASTTLLQHILLLLWINTANLYSCHMRNQPVCPATHHEPHYWNTSSYKSTAKDNEWSKHSRITAQYHNFIAGHDNWLPSNAIFLLCYISAMLPNTRLFIENVCF